MIEVAELTRRFGPRTVVSGLSFKVQPGEVLGFLGPNGAGKSTTMKMLTGFLRPNAGTARLCGFDVQTQPVEVQRRVGYLPEGAPLYADMTPLELLEFVAAVRGLSGATRRQRLQTAVEQVHLESVLHQPIETLSKGFKRRVGLAQSILHDPEVLILDEPTDGLDPNQKHDVRNLIRTMARDKVVVLSTHILEEVDAVCTRAAIIADGRLVADGTPAELEARSHLHNAVTLTIAGAPPARTALEHIPGVAAVEELSADPGEYCCRLYPEPGAALAGAVNAAACAGSWQVRGIHVERGRLDEVFRALTAGPEAERDAA